MDIQLLIAIGSVTVSIVFWFRAHILATYEQEQAFQRVMNSLSLQADLIENLTNTVSLLRDHVIELKSRTNAKTL